MLQTWLNKCAMSQKQDLMRIFDVEMTVPSSCKTEKIRNWTFLNWAFLRSIAAWNGANFCHGLEGCQLPMLCSGEPEPPAGYCYGYPSKPPAICHLWCGISPWKEAEIRWFCMFLIIEIQRTVASSVKHTNNHVQPLCLQFLPFSNRNYVHLLQTPLRSRGWSHYPAVNLA